NVIDVLHGNITLPLRPGFASGNYTVDVSDYVAGIMLGIEWDPKFVINTNNNNPERSIYNGDYLYTLNATPFETFLCSVGDEVIRYQTEKYSYQVPVAFTNWVTTDPLSHPNEPHPDEDRVSVNMENIKSRKEYLPGMFLSYHVYPYYPDVLNYEKDYINYTDPYGKKNPYRAYLKDLKSIHAMPIVIAEFGIPTSRGRGHESVMGYHQGFVDETEQGQMIVDMMRSMYEENYAGGLVFTWQDEWFKRTWNNVAFDVPDSRPFWSNIQTNEQNFGILAFDPGAESVCQIDGDISEWEESTPVIAGNAGSLYIKSDARYMYLMIKAENFDFEKDTLYIPIDTIENQGNLFLGGTRVTFDRPADFLITINGKDNTRITVDSYYDSFYYLFGEQYKMIPLIADIRTKNSGRFNTMQMCYNYEFVVPDTKTVVPFRSYETGKLLYGISNPDSPEYKSLADFYHKDNVIELRIPWQLLNVMDPSTLRIMDDLYTMQSIVPTKTSGFHFGLAKKRAADEPVTIKMNGVYIWDSWILPEYRERLKPSYKVLQEAFPAFK
ncbi:MAG TPA: family 2 glycosyl transferase, partial [Clostridia bacterium]|nr:family 2 glycosyl transferase [Clostridia bacterium]